MRVNTTDLIQAIKSVDPVSDNGITIDAGTETVTVRAFTDSIYAASYVRVSARCDPFSVRVAYELVPGLIAMLRDIDDDNTYLDFANDALFVNEKSIPVRTPDDMPTWTSYADPAFARQTSHGFADLNLALYCANMIIGNNPLGVINIAQLAHNNLHISISNVWNWECYIRSATN